MDAQPRSFTSYFVRVAPRVSGALYEPTNPVRRSLAIVVMHDSHDFLDSPVAIQLAERGHRVLAANPRFAPSLDDHDTDWAQALQDLDAAVVFARALPHIERVVMVGHSSGAALAACHQNFAENGASAAVGSLEYGSEAYAAHAAFQRADGLILLDPIFGVAANVLASMDPAITDEDEPSRRDPALDLFNPENGFDPAGASYSEPFRRAYLSAQAERNARLIERALSRMAALSAGRGRYADDEPFLIPGATRIPSLWRPDISLLKQTRGEHDLSCEDGIKHEIIRSCRGPMGLAPTSGLLAGALPTTVKRFLSTFACRSTSSYDVTADAIEGVVWNSSLTSVADNLRHVHSPVLIAGMTGHYWIVSAEIAYQAAASENRHVIFIEGATHGFTPLAAHEKMRERFGDTMKRTFDHTADWIESNV